MTSSQPLTHTDTRTLSDHLHELVEDANDAAESYRQSLADHALTLAPSSLAAYLNDVAYQSGRVSMFNLAALVADATNNDTARVLAECVAKLVYGADDKSSGRTNDVQRAQFDGVRDAHRDLVDLINQL